MPSLPRRRHRARAARFVNVAPALYKAGQQCSEQPTRGVPRSSFGYWSAYWSACSQVSFYVFGGKYDELASYVVQLQPKPRTHAEVVALLKDRLKYSTSPL